MSETSIQKLAEERLLRRWADLARDLSLVGDVSATGRGLLERYTETHRQYHDIEHIRECLELLDTVAHMAGDAPAIEAAIWFHDAIYKGGAGDNVKRSANLARDTLTGLSAPAALAEKVRVLVVVTDHSALPDEPDARLLCDIDLARLAASPEQFDANTEALRAEVDLTDTEFDRRRKAFLEEVLRRETIFCTDYFRRKLESAARANIGRALADLAGVDAGATAPKRPARNAVPRVEESNPRTRGHR